MASSASYLHITQLLQSSLSVQEKQAEIARTFFFPRSLPRTVQWDKDDELSTCSGWTSVTTSSTALTVPIQGVEPEALDLGGGELSVDSVEGDSSTDSPTLYSKGEMSDSHETGVSSSCVAGDSSNSCFSLCNI